MSNQRQGKTYLDTAELKGKAIIKGFALYDLGYYPGIVEDIDGKVKGELYLVPKSKLPDIDVYEAEGSLYKRKKVKAYVKESEEVEAYVYVYNKSVKGKKKIDFREQPWFQRISDFSRNYVWYACYGSNVNRERFMKYIRKCEDTTPPMEEEPMLIEHPIYFANKSGRWDNKGVAFLDISRKGICYGKRYLITLEQLEEIHIQEGPSERWYNKLVDLGSEDGIPIKTITHYPSDLEENMPSNSYLEVIRKGVQEAYPNLTKVDIEVYLFERFLKVGEMELLIFLRNQEHGVAIKKIAEGINRYVSKTTESICVLRDIGLIKQDSRSVRAGAAWKDEDAVYYTNAKKREVIDRVILDKGVQL